MDRNGRASFCVFRHYIFLNLEPDAACACEINRSIMTEISRCCSYSTSSELLYELYGTARKSATRVQGRGVQVQCEPNQPIRIGNQFSQALPLLGPSSHIHTTTVLLHQYGTTHILASWHRPSITSSVTSCNSFTAITIVVYTTSTVYYFPATRLVGWTRKNIHSEASEERASTFRRLYYITAIPYILALDTHKVTNLEGRRLNTVYSHILYPL
jgi:hypothetical protein